MARVPTPGYSLTIRAELKGGFDDIASAVIRAGGELSAVDVVRARGGLITRDITLNARDEGHEREIVKSVRAVPGVNVIRVMDRTFSAHQGGKIEIRNRLPLRDREDLSRVYSPGVGRVARDILLNRQHAFRYTIKGNSVAVVTDGTAVMGLGDIGPEAAMPVVEGKCMIFREFAGINAFPVALATKDAGEIVSTVINISPAFGGINLEDISAPRCFLIEKKLRAALDIPVVHDDQHGTAIVVLAALTNVARLLRKDIRKFKVVVAGAGAAGTAAALLLRAHGIKDIVVCDRAGAIYRGRRNMAPHKRGLAGLTNPRKVRGSLREAMRGAGVFVGLSAPNIITPEDIRGMAERPVLLTLANPEPEIAPEEALPLAGVLATGRSDYPNQVNNMLAFPGLFRGLLDMRARVLTDKIKFAASAAIARMVGDDELRADYILPGIFDRRVTESVARAVARAAGGER